MRRTRCNEGEAVTLREGTDKGTGEASRGKGPGTYGGIAEKASGRTIFQQGLVRTCKDPLNKENRIRREGFGLAHESVGAKKEG
jgi:hypothetical protein